MQQTLHAYCSCSSVWLDSFGLVRRSSGRVYTNIVERELHIDVAPRGHGAISRDREAVIRTWLKGAFAQALHLEVTEPEVETEKALVRGSSTTVRLVPRCVLNGELVSQHEREEGCVPDRHRISKHLGLGTNGNGKKK
jgi:hypothetical protein